MIFTLIFEILLLIFHSANSFQFLNGNDENIPVVRDGSVAIFAKTDTRFKSCSLKKNETQICKVTCEWSKISYSLRMTYTPNYSHVTFTGDMSYYDCKFLVPNLQENGNKNQYVLFLSRCGMTSFTNFVLLEILVSGPWN
jgi:hypothetical protein